MYSVLNELFQIRLHCGTTKAESRCGPPIVSPEQTPDRMNHAFPGRRDTVTFIPPLTPADVEPSCAGTYRDLTIVHSGGQGMVFRAIGSGPTPVDVALKVYFPTVQGYMERSDREVQALGQVSCPYIVRLHGAGRFPIRGQVCPFVATTFVEGETLSERLSRGPLSPQTTARIGHDVALAIDTLWSARVVHRDVKPSNIMLATGGSAVVIDLGVARHIGLDSLYLFTM